MTTTQSNLAPTTTTSSSGRRVLRRTLNDALAIAGNAVQLDAAGEYARSIEAYQQSVDLLDHGIALMRLQPERAGRDASHEIAQLEQIREKYSARIRAHQSERTSSRRTNGAETTTSHSAQSPNSTSSRRPRTPQGSTSIPPAQPPPSAPLPPIPGIVSDDNSTVLTTTRPRGTSLPASQVEVKRQRNEEPLPNLPVEIAPPAKAATTTIRSPKSSEALSGSNQTIQLDAFPAPRKRSKSAGRPQTAPDPSSLPPPLPGNPVRVRTTSGATPPKRSHSSTALSKSASQSHLPSRLINPGTARPTHLSPSPISAIPKRLDLIPLQKAPAQQQLSPFIAIYGLQPALRVTAPPPAPAPTDSQRRPYHLLRLLQSTLVQAPSPGSVGFGRANQSGGGGFLTPKLYIPSALWHHPELWTLILDLSDKARLLETLREAMRSLHETSTIHFGPVLFSAVRSPTKLKRNPSVDNLAQGRMGREDPGEWLTALDQFSKALTEIEKNSGKKLGLGENGASVTKKMMDWSTRVAKKTIGGKGPSNELRDSYVDALIGVCNLSAMLDAHLCALRTVVPGSKPPTRRPTFSRTATSEAIRPTTPGFMPDFSMDPDVLPPAISQLVPKYSNLPKYATTTALAHLEKTTHVFSTVILPLILRDLAVLIEGLQRMRNGEWMGALL